jgi:cobyrinic acid a,c-diamide synthase
VQGLYIGGGFPEMFMDALFARNEILQQMHHAIMAGLPTYAECGGLMLLAERLYWQSRHVPLCGVLPIEVEMKEKPQGYGYMEIESTGVLPWPPLGSRVRCHEFHYSRVRALSDDVRYAYRVRRGSGVDGVHDGLVYRKVLASYAHIHAVGAPGWANFLARFWGLE